MSRAGLTPLRILSLATALSIVVVAVPATSAAASTGPTTLGSQATQQSDVTPLAVGPLITEQPTNQVVAPGAVFSLTSAATGEPDLAVQWQSAPSASGPWGDVAGAIDPTLTANATSSPTTVVWYQAVWTDSSGSTTSNPASVTTTDVKPNPVAFVGVTNPSPNTLVATWPASSGAGPVTSYTATLLNSSGAPVRSVRTTSRSVTWTALAAGTYRVKVVAANATTSSAATLSSALAVKALVRTAVLTSSVLRPYRDGFQDTITARATSTFSASGSVKIRNRSGKIVRTYPLASGTSWSVAINGRAANGTRLPFGTYAAVTTLGGKVVATRSFTIRSSQVSISSVSKDRGTVYPYRDGYADTVAFKIRASLPATGTVKVLVGGRVAWSSRLSRNTTWSIRWNGRFGTRMAPAGSYKVVVELKGGEGTKRTRSTTVSVSAKKLTNVTFSATYSASVARDDCGGFGYIVCESVYWTIDGVSGPATRYYTGISDDDLMWSAHSVPLPSGTTRWRIRAVADTYDATYVLGYCYSNASDVDDCPSGLGGSFPLYSEGTFVFPWTSVGSGDGYADFFIGSYDWGSIYVSTFTVDYVKQVLR
jgi:hypothetical protein